MKTMLLHHSQEILEDTVKGLKIKLFLVLTYDFERTILFYYDRMKILEPKSFKNKMKKALEEEKGLLVEWEGKGEVNLAEKIENLLNILLKKVKIL